MNNTRSTVIVFCAIVAFFAIFAGPPAYICYVMAYPYYVYEVIQGFWAVIVLGVSYILYEWFNR